MYNKDSISVGKRDEDDWNILKPIVIDIISDYFTKNTELFDSDYKHGEHEVLIQYILLYIIYNIYYIF